MAAWAVSCLLLLAVVLGLVGVVLTVVVDPLLLTRLLLFIAVGVRYGVPRSPADLPSVAPHVVSTARFAK